MPDMDWISRGCDYFATPADAAMLFDEVESKHPLKYVAYGVVPEGAERATYETHSEVPGWTTKPALEKSKLVMIFFRDAELTYSERTLSKVVWGATSGRELDLSQIGGRLQHLPCERFDDHMTRGTFSVRPWRDRNRELYQLFFNALRRKFNRHGAFFGPEATALLRQGGRLSINGINDYPADWV